MTGETLIQLALAIPTLGALGIALTGFNRNVREAVTLITAAALFFVVVLNLLPMVLAGDRPAWVATTVFGVIDIAFEIEPLGMLFACIASSLWIVNSIYSIGYMRGNNEPRQTPFYTCFAIAIASAMGIAFAGNLFTLFLFYEVLTISTYPLVAHKGNEEARLKARVYIVLLMATSMALLLPAIIWTYAASGTADFAAGGILAGAGLSGILLTGLYTLYIFGIGKAAVMPVHFWLPAAMVAPTPVSALLHAVAVVKAGVFCVVKITLYVFGLDLLSETGASVPIAYIAGTTVVLASVIALGQDNLKRRLAFSTISQLSYVVMAAAIATPIAIIGAAMHILAHAVSKITLFFAAGSIYTAHHLTEVSQLDGLGRKMPLTFVAFLIGAVSIIGLPPLIGVWSKWQIGIGAAGAGDYWAVAVLMISSLLNVAYLLPIVSRGFFLPLPGQDPDAPVARAEAPMPILIALTITSTLTFALFFAANPVETLLLPMVEVPDGQ
ncbi:MAG: monovalent cation/H+ antiporter subunit D family protein [Pseudomonadota bacterium]